MPMMVRIALALLLASAAVPMSTQARGGGPAADALTRELLKRAEFQGVSISPDGKKLAISRVIDDRDTHKTIVTIHDRDTLAVIVSFDPGYAGEITTLRWFDDQRLIIGATRRDVSFNLALFSPILTIANLDGSKPKELPGHFYSMLEGDPEHFLVYNCSFAKGAKGCAVPEVRKTDLKHLYGKGDLVMAGPPDTILLADAQGRAGVAFGTDEDDGTSRTYAYNASSKQWDLLNDSRTSGLEVFPLMLTRDGKQALFQTQRKDGPDVVETYDPATGKRAALYADPESDPITLVTSFDDDAVIGAYYNPTSPRLHLFKPDHPDAALIQELQAAFPGRIVVPGSSSKDRNFVVLRVYSDRDPGSYYVFDRQARKASQLTRRKPWIDPAKQAPQRAVSFKARDGELLHGLLTVPPGSNGKNLPLVVLPHGGPYGITDAWGYDRELQVLAQHGYGVLQVNFRGSGGYGHRFTRIGERQWGRAMQDDVTDATRWAIADGVADSGRVCIYGASYGGYAALMGAIREPTLYRCAVGVSGVFDLSKMFRWGSIRSTDVGKLYLKRVLGEDPAELAANSPVTLADHIQVPVLLMHGELDPRVPVGHAVAMRKALRKAGKPVELVQYSRTGHSIMIEEYELDYYARLLQFLDANLGARTGPTAAATAGAAASP